MPRARRAPSPSVLLAVLLAALLQVAPAAAHEGPPFPVVIDAPLGDYVVSVWTDPDIGVGTVFVVLEPAEGVELSGEARVRVGVEPLAGWRDEVRYEAPPQAVRRGARHFTEVTMERGEMYRLRVTVDGPLGSGEVAAEVEATPDGTIGPIGLLLYPLPFLAVGFLWLKAALGRRGQRPAQGSGSS